MRKFHWISMVLLAAPFAFANACGGDDTAPGGTAGSSAGSSGAGGDGTAGTSSTGGSSGSASTGGSSGSASTGGSAGTAGSGTGGMAGTAAPDSGGGGSATSGDAAAEASTDDGASAKCTNGNATGGDGKSCADVCGTYFKICKARPATADTYATQAACVTACKALTQVQLCCRAQHAATLSSQANPDNDYIDLHCPHVIGMNPCT